MAEGAGVVLRCEARNFAFDVHGDVELEETLNALFVALERTGGSPAAEFSVRRAAGDGTAWQVRMDGELMMASEQRGEALHGLIVFINQRVVMARDDLLSVHAAAVAIPRGAVILPGDAGSGKTTLCARLLQLGAAYLSDDSVAIDPGGRVLGYPKPLGFKIGTWEQFSDAGLADLEFDPGTQLVWQVPPDRLGATIATSAEPLALALPRFEAGAQLRIEPISRHAAAAAVLGQIQNLPAFGVPAALELIGRLAARVPAHAVVYGDARQAAPAVLELLAEAQRTDALYQVIEAEPRSGQPTQPFPAADASALCFEDGALLVRRSGEWIAVDAVGAVLWPLLDGQRTAESIGRDLSGALGVTHPDIETDIARWTTQLVEQGFLVQP